MVPVRANAEIGTPTPARADGSSTRLALRADEKSTIPRTLILKETPKEPAEDTRLGVRFSSAHLRF